MQFRCILRNMKHIIRMSDVAELSVGHPFRTSLADEPPGLVRVVSMAHSIGESLTADADLPKIDFRGNVSRLQLAADDLLFRPRGTSTQAIYIESVNQPCIFAAPLIRVRVSNPQQMHGWYLHWLLNSPAIQRDINAQARGSMIRMVSLESLRNLQIPVPSMRVQLEIAEVASLLRQERMLAEALMEKNKMYTEQVLWAKAQEVR